MDDDELDRLLRAANPVRTERDKAPDRELMLRIMEEPRPRVTTRPAARFAAVVAPMAAVIVAVMALVITNPFAQSPAAAYGPPPLQWTATQKTLDEVTEMTLNQLAQASGPATADRQSTVTAWSVSISEAGEADEVTTISPLVTELSWQEDLSGRRLVTAGTPYSAAGGRESETGSLPSDAVPPGTIIDDMAFAPGEYQALVPNAGTMDAAGFEQLLGMYAPTDAGFRAGDAMIGVSELLGEWTLTNAQHGYLIEALVKYDGLSVLGTATDRLGREVIGLRADASLRPGETTTLLISSATGRIVGMEIAVTGADASTPVPVGTVIHYAAWKDSE